jgi:hypothetical protein
MNRIIIAIRKLTSRVHQMSEDLTTALLHQNAQLDELCMEVCVKHGQEID